MQGKSESDKNTNISDLHAKKTSCAGGRALATVFSGGIGNDLSRLLVFMKAMPAKISRAPDFAGCPDSERVRFFCRAACRRGGNTGAGERCFVEIRLVHRVQCGYDSKH